MGTNIREDKYLNAEAYILENQYMKIAVLKDLGAKIASIFHKPVGFELLAQPSKSYYDFVEDGDLENPELLARQIDFAKFDTSGLDDCFPTIDACTYEEYYLPDHGELWYSKPRFDLYSWEFPRHLHKDIADDEEITALRACFGCYSLPFSFQRSLILKDECLYLDYEICNNSQEKLPYLWALHGLFSYDKNLELVLPEGELVNVRQNCPEDTYDFSSFDKCDLSQYPSKAMVKFYMEHPVDNGRAELLYKKQNLRVIYNWKARKNPYLGVWVTTGGFKGENNVAVEPCSGYYDSLRRAVELDKSSYLEAGEKAKWLVELRFLPLRDFR